jgi:tyrosine-protein kinase Etk/Wzc
MDMRRQDDSRLHTEGHQGVTPYVLGVLRWKKWILGFVLAVTILAGIVSFLLPKWYKSNALLLLPKNQGLGAMGSLTTLLRDFSPTGVAGKLGGGSGQLNYLAILNSRRAGEALIRKFDLIRVYGVDDGSMEKALEEFARNFSVEIQEDGGIGLSIYDRDSLRAAEMTNAMVEVLNTIAIELGTGEARNTRLFLEKRVEENRAALTVAEDKLRAFQERRGMIVLSEDAKATAAAIGELFAKKIKLDIELSILMKTAGQENEAFRQLSLERNELERKLSTFPEIGLESFRLFRDVMVQQKIMEYLIPMYEQARFEEHRDVPVVSVLDKGVPAEKKARPKRMLIIAAAALSALILGLMAAMAALRLHMFRLENPEGYHRLMDALRPSRARSSV